MSQITKLFDGTSAPSIEFVTGDVGGAVGPTLGNINFLTGDGLTSTGTPGTSTITLTIDGLTQATGQTIGAVTADLITINLGAVPTTYIIEAKIVGFEATTPAGCGYNILCMARTTGAASSIIGIDKYNSEDLALVACDATCVASGNSIVIRVTGTIGLTLNWKANITSMGV
jgi:hypothetical protein